MSDYPTVCCQCDIAFTLPRESIPELARTRKVFCCPCGHEQFFNDHGARSAIEWLRVADWPAPPPEPTPEQRLEAKIRDIDDYLARRGRYAALLLAVVGALSACLEPQAATHYTTSHGVTVDLLGGELQRPAVTGEPVVGGGAARRPLRVSSTPQQGAPQARSRPLLHPTRRRAARAPSGDARLRPRAAPAARAAAALARGAPRRATGATSSSASTLKARSGSRGSLRAAWRGSGSRSDPPCW